MHDHSHIPLSSNDPLTVSDGMPHCRDCRWWNQGHEALSDLPGGFVSGPIKTGGGVCLLTETKSLEPVHAQSKAIVWEGDQYVGVLVTAPDFGCVQFEVKL